MDRLDCAERGNQTTIRIETELEKRGSKGLNHWQFIQQTAKTKRCKKELDEKSID